jgi:hypothetical protein
VRRAEHIARAPESAKGVIARAFKKIASPREAIKAKCLECCNYSRDEISSCTVVLCPLHNYRPFAAVKAR